MLFQEDQLLSTRHCINCGRPNDGTAMLLLLHQELNAQNVGLKGHGFFTCSYGFIGTVRWHMIRVGLLSHGLILMTVSILQVLGMISTYSVIVIQSQA